MDWDKLIRDWEPFLLMAMGIVVILIAIWAMVRMA